MVLNKCGFDKFLRLMFFLKYRNYFLVSYNFIYFFVFILLFENFMICLIDYCGICLKEMFDYEFELLVK